MFNENVDPNKYNNDTKVKSSIIDKQCKMLENCNHCKKLIKSIKLLNYSSRHLPTIQRKTIKHNRNVKECSKQRSKLFKQEQSVSFVAN